MEKPVQSKPQSPVIQAALGSPKFNRLKQSQAQSKPTTPEKTDLTNGEHAGSGSGKVISENGDAPRERGSSLSGTPRVLSFSSCERESMLGTVKECGDLCRKPLTAAHLFLGLPLDSPFAFHSQRGMMASAPRSAL